LHDDQIERYRLEKSGQQIHRSHPQVLPDDGIVHVDLGRGAMVAHLALLHDVNALAGFERERHVLLDEKNGDAVTMRGISPSVGSSSRMIFGSSIIARAIASICCSPPDSVPPAWLRRSARTGKNVNTLSSKAAFRSPVTPPRSRPVRKFSITVR